MFWGPGEATRPRAALEPWCGRPLGLEGAWSEEQQVCMGGHEWWLLACPVGVAHP